MPDMDEKPLMEYEVERTTQYGQYTAVVTVTRQPRKTHIKLYSPAPMITVFKFFPVEIEPIREATYGALVDVDRAITRMIVDWELVFYQRDKAEASDGYLNINYAEEIKRRRAQFEQQEEEEVQPREDEIIYRDWREDKAIILGGKSGAQAEPKKKMHVNSLLNLRQYQHLKK